VSDPRPLHPSPEPCRICGGRLRLAFEGLLFGDTPVRYGVCEDCRSLLLPEPTWLERAYTTAFSPDPDAGELQRTLYVHRVLRRLRHHGLLPRRFRSLDFGCGKAALVRLLLDDGCDAWGQDAYPRAAYAAERVSAAWPDGAFDLVTAVEVIEHTLDPVAVLAELRERLAPSGLLVLTTELFQDGVHGPDWVYLAPEHGQHVTIFSAEGLGRAAAEAGLSPVLTLPWAGKDFLHVFARPGHAPSAWGRLRLRLAHRGRERRARRDACA
jgi:SAM-dependent methyltransferase